jgi:S1-C subfamily serine protease
MNSLVTLSEDLAAAVQQAARAVVAVHARPRLPSTGIHWRPGLVVTADHTVRTDEGVTVTRPDGQSVAATIVGRDATLDVALLRIDAGDVPVADIADSDGVRVGHIVLALGTGPRVSWGVVSVIGAGAAAPALGDVFGLDLTLYPGFSGGPLVDTRGSVVGLNTSGAARHLQFAIPTNTVGRAVDELVRHGRIARAYLGVGTQPVRLSDEDRTAVIVVDIQAGSPAARSLMLGDVIVSLDGRAVSDPFELRALLRSTRVGQRLTATIVRAGQRLDVELTVGERPARGR